MKMGLFGVFGTHTTVNVNDKFSLENRHLTQISQENKKSLEFNLHLR